MGTISDYADGKILTDISKAYHVFRKHEGSLAECDVGQRMLKNIAEFEPAVISMKEAVVALHHARTVAVGERVCRKLHPDSSFTESVFLDELAEAMIEKGHVIRCTADEAEKTLYRYPKSPLIISKVSGKHQEICRSHPPECVYWLAEKRGLRCLNRPKKQPSIT